MKDRRKPWQKAMINKEFRFSRCGSMLQSTARAWRTADAAHAQQRRHIVQGDYVQRAVFQYAEAMGLSVSEASKRIAEQHRRVESGFRVHSHAIATEWRAMTTRHDNTWRRYVMANGVLCILKGTRRNAVWIPDHTPHVGIQVSRQSAADRLRLERSWGT